MLVSARPATTALALVAVALSLAGCGNALDRLSEIGKGPKLAAIEDPTAQPGYKPVAMPMPAPEPPAYAPNSLWSKGSRAFFKDQRAHRVDDILTVQVVITDKAQIANDTKRSRDETDSGESSIGHFMARRVSTRQPSPLASNSATA